MSQREVLSQVATHPGVGTSAIASTLQLAPNTVSGIDSALVRSGHLVREQDPADKRAWKLYLSAPAAERREARWDRGADVVTRAMEALPQREREQIIQSLPALEALRESMRVLRHHDLGGSE